MTKAKDMAQQLRGALYDGPHAEHVRQVIVWLDMQGDGLLARNMEDYLQQLVKEMSGCGIVLSFSSMSLRPAD